MHGAIADWGVAVTSLLLEKESGVTGAAMDLSKDDFLVRTLGNMLKVASLSAGVPQIRNAVGKTLKRKGKHLGAVPRCCRRCDRNTLRRRGVIHNEGRLAYFAHIHWNTTDLFHSLISTITKHISSILRIALVVESIKLVLAVETHELIGVHLNHLKTLIGKVRVG